MNFPYGPYGQQFPGQPPGYPQQPGYPLPPGYPQHAGYPGGQQPYGMPPMPPASPSGLTGILAGVLAGLGGIANFGGGIVMAFGLAVIMGESTVDTGAAVTGSMWTGLIAITMLNIISGLLLLIGAVMLLLRKIVGRGLVIVGCALNILSSLVSLSLPSTIADYEYGDTGSDVVTLIFPIATIVLTLLPSTTAWIQAERNPVTPQYYPRY